MGREPGPWSGVQIPQRPTVGCRGRRKSSLRHVRRLANCLASSLTRVRGAAGRTPSPGRRLCRARRPFGRRPRGGSNTPGEGGMKLIKSKKGTRPSRDAGRGGLAAVGAYAYFTSTGNGHQRRLRPSLALRPRSSVVVNDATGPALVSGAWRCHAYRRHVTVTTRTSRTSTSTRLKLEVLGTVTLAVGAVELPHQQRRDVGRRVGSRCAPPAGTLHPVARRRSDGDVHAAVIETGASPGLCQGAGQPQATRRASTDRGWGGLLRRPPHQLFDDTTTTDTREGEQGF